MTIKAPILKVVLLGICTVSLYYNAQHYHLTHVHGNPEPIMELTKHGNTKYQSEVIPSETENRQDKSTLSSKTGLRSDPALDNYDKVKLDMISTQNTLGVKGNKTFNCAINFGEWPEGTKEKVWLTSFPRSGNTWTRHLLEVATGIYTGSCHNANGLYMHGFKGELDKPGQGQKLVYKCHSVNIKTFKFGILLIRNLYDSLLSLHAFHLNGMMGDPSLELFRKSTDFVDMVKKKHESWRNLVVSWFKSGNPFLVVHYEDLVQNPIQNVKKMVNFLNITLTPERLKCLRNDIEGLYHRQHPAKFHFDPFTQELHEIIDEDIRVVNELLMSRNETPVPQPAYNTEL
ncbi:sialate:O-sulfotransferase 1-like [Saccoglossus kowalevskii]|uniref:WSC domain-containing protein 1-like n=1 Tax=Saccoglossus kowalevskii TaxID=10224 RepID=A0ABM0MY41_SACKO|nr:PREDICTED: WSC domain-containing protein 1-like [Saccoglossus kowalevskii]